MNFLEFVPAILLVLILCAGLLLYWNAKRKRATKTKNRVQALDHLYNHRNVEVVGQDGKCLTIAWKAKDEYALDDYWYIHPNYPEAFAEARWALAYAENKVGEVKHYKLY